MAFVEFVAGVTALRFGLPLGSIALAVAGLVLTLVGLYGMVRPLARPRSRPYMDEAPL